ncbi:uncharacterized protein LOC134537953 isoform X2 [Bacillus rossius redtenbacheri]
MEVAIPAATLRTIGATTCDAPIVDAKSDDVLGISMEMQTTPDDVGIHPGTSKEAGINADAEWKEPETKLLLDKYAAHLDKVGPMKRFRTKKVMWEQIASDIENILSIKRTGIQCQNRFKTIMKRKKLAMTNNSTSGSTREAVPFETEYRAIAAVDDSLVPDVMRGVDKVILNSKPIPTSENFDAGPMSSPSSSFSSSSSCQSPSPIVKKKRHNKIKELSDLLHELHTLREAAKERRQKEKMEFLKELFKKE